MFEDLLLLSSPERDIPLYTRMRRPVRNSQSTEPDDLARRKFARLLERHGRWEFRKPPCGTYNCFGHVWASRRTAVYDQADIEVILDDDGYRRFVAADVPQCGDLALYYDPSERWIYHVGVISELRHLFSPTGATLGFPVPWVLSKWDDASGEVLHQLEDVPWSENEFKVTFWTDRP